jgi:hypothetical protein
MKEKLTINFNDTYWEHHYTIVSERVPGFLNEVNCMGNIRERQLSLIKICPNKKALLRGLFIEQKITR